MALTKKQSELMHQWNLAQTALAEAKRNEDSLRDQVVKMLYPNGVPKGTNHFPLDNGYQLNAVGTINYKIDIAAMTPIIKAIREKFKINAAVAIKTKYELSVTEYNKLSDDVKAMFDEALEAKPGKPQLEIVKPKR